MSLNDKPLDSIHEIVANIHEMVAKEIIAQLRAELSRTQMAGCESPLANVIHSVIGDCMVFTDTVLEAGALQRVRSPGARCGVVGSGNASPDLH